MEPEAKQSRAEITRRPWRKRRQLVAAVLVQDFAQNTTLHGLRYVAERGLSLAERIFWMVAFVISFSLCTMLIIKVWVKWQTSPIIFVPGDKPISVGEVPFPAITICPEYKIKRFVVNGSDIFHKNLPTRFWNLNKTAQDHYNMVAAIGLLCSDYDFYHGNDADANMFDHLFEVTPKIRDVLDLNNCIVNQHLFPCHELFRPVLTKGGVCYTMNTLAANEILRVENVNHYNYLNTSKPSKGWSYSDGFYSTNNTDVYPRRGRIYGDDAFLTIILKHNPQRFRECTPYDEGYKVYLQYPADMPQYSVHYHSALREQMVKIFVKLNILNTSSSLKDYSSESRQCYFPNERQLKYFRAYTANNCRLECLSNYTIKHCGCNLFYLPHGNDTQTCRKNETICLMLTMQSYASEDGLPDTEVGRCQCLPLCNDIQYDADILKATLNYSRVQAFEKRQGRTTYRLENLNPNDKITIVELHYKAPQFISMQRSELFGLTDFLANCGGLLGLFLGFSFLSLVEIFYFLTLRVGCAVQRDNQHPDTTTVNKENCSCHSMKVKNDE